MHNTEGMDNIWQCIHRWLLGNENVVVITVVEVLGSSPGKRGIKMAVSSSGTTAGTIGGGPMEYSMTRLAMEFLEQDNADAFTKKQVHSPDAGPDASGLICAGEQTHAFVKLLPSHASIVSSLLQHQEKGRKCILEFSPGGMKVVPEAARTGEEKSWTMAHGRWTYREVITPQETVYIFGGGHLSVPLSQTCAMLGFRVIVLDNRPQLSTMKNNNHAHQKIRIDYGDAARHIAHHDTSYICIMTVSHASDQEILEQLLTLPVKYLGMIGSKNKVRTIFSSIRNKGTDPSLLERIHSPMGINIPSETPAEIAISIAAELIHVKNGR